MVSWPLCQHSRLVQAGPAGTGVSARVGAGVNLSRGFQLRRSPWLPVWQRTISATSRPELGDRELVETAPKTRLLPARHVVCASASWKSTGLSISFVSPVAKPFGQVCPRPLILVPKYIRQGARGLEFYSHPISL